MNSKSIFLVIFALCAFLKSFGQETAHTKEIQIFLHTGVNLFGTSSDIKTGMEKSGMADSQTSYFLFSASKTEYPIVYKYPLANLGVSYFFTKTRSVNIFLQKKWPGTNFLNCFLLF